MRTLANTHVFAFKRALISIFESGRARSIGVSNYNTTHLQEILDAGYTRI